MGKKSKLRLIGDILVAYEAVEIVVLVIASIAGITMSIVNGAFNLEGIAAFFGNIVEFFKNLFSMEPAQIVQTILKGWWVVVLLLLPGILGYIFLEIDDQKND